MPGRPSTLAYSSARAGAGWMGCFFIISSILCSVSNALSLEGRLDMTEILWFRPL